VLNALHLHHRHHVANVPRRTDLRTFVEHLARRWIVFYCVNSNERAAQVEKQLNKADVAVVRRVVSKARYLVEYLQKHDIWDFEVQYGATKSPYAAAPVDMSSTIEQLERALTAKGLSHLNGQSAKVLVKALLEERKSPRIDATAANVTVITTPNFLARTLQWREPWWVSMGLKGGTRLVGVRGSGKYYPAVDYDGFELEPGERRVPVLGYQVVVLFEHPKGDEFDEARPVAEQHVAELRVKHDLFEEDGQWYERRPKEQIFGAGLQRGCRGGAAPQGVVVTSDDFVARAAARTLKQAEYWRLRPRTHKTLRGM